MSVRFVPALLLWLANKRHIKSVDWCNCLRCSTGADPVHVPDETYSTCLNLNLSQYQKARPAATLHLHWYFLLVCRSAAVCERTTSQGCGSVGLQSNAM